MEWFSVGIIEDRQRARSKLRVAASKNPVTPEKLTGHGQKKKKIIFALLFCRPI